MPGASTVSAPWTVSVHSPDSHEASTHVRSAVTGDVAVVPMTRLGPRWTATVDAADGDEYWLVVDGVGPLVDPHARDVVVTIDGPRGIVRRDWPRGTRLGRSTPAPVVYEMHVRGFARNFAGVRGRLPYLADLGIDVIELMPVHPFDPGDNYWGYMPIVWGAVHRPYADGDDAAGELAELIAAAHEHGIAVWLDVVFNHTGEGDGTKPTWTLRGLDDAHAYRRDADGSYNDDAGCGNVVDVGDANVRQLVLEALQRFADLGVDGFRFDLASILSRDGGAFVHEIGDWAEPLGITLVAEAWDLARYEVGAGFPDRRWLQWNDRFRDDVRGFLRGEPGMVGAMLDRVAGSPGLFPAGAAGGVNFLTAHDGLTMHDLTAVTSDRHRSWDAGDGLRRQQIANAFALLLMAAGPCMFVMGDEGGRTQRGLDNPYDVDSEVTWLDWERLEEWRELHDLVRTLIAHRRRHPVIAPTFRGPCGPPDTSAESRCLSWSTGDLQVMANMWWESVTFPAGDGPWRLAVSTSAGVTFDGAAAHLPGRTVAVLVREERV